MKPENVTCPECHGPMVSRLNKRDNSRFWGCKRYPDCRGTLTVDGVARPRRRAYDTDDDEQPAADRLPSQEWNGRDRRRWDR